MNSRLKSLANRIRNDLVELERVLQRVENGWEIASRQGDDYYRDSVALNLHGWYSGLERIFVLIAETLDGKLPKGENWHQTLLIQMTEEVSGIRPAVISEQSSERLADYRGFRHIVRNVYTFQFDPAKMEKLVLGVPGVYNIVKAELLAFASFLER
jgi:hypothetical protein